MLYTFFAILPFMVCLFWTMILLLDWQKEDVPKRVLAIFFIVSTILYLCHALFFASKEGFKPLANSVYAFCNLAVYPLYYFYIKRLTDKRTDSQQTFKTVVYLFFPSFVLGLWSVVNNFFLTENSVSEYIRLEVGKILFLVLVLPVCYFGIKCLNDFERKIDNYYSETENRSVGKIKALMIVLLVCSLSSVIANHFGRSYFNGSMLLAIPSFIFGALLFAVGYVGSHQKFSIDDLEKEMYEEDSTDILQNSEVQKLVNEAGAINNKLRDKFEMLMVEKQLFLRCDLKLNDVAKELGISRTALSAFMNQSIGMPFSEYVNRLRINYAKEYLLQNKQDSIKLVHSCVLFGFSSESSFYRSFRRYTGKTPSQLLREFQDLSDH